MRPTPTMTNRTPQPRGFTLLIAVLVAGILLALGVAIFNIVSKDILLSSSGRESQAAFYAADSGVECALYADYKEDKFSTSSPSVPVCRGLTVSNYAVSHTGSIYTTTFSFALGASTNDPCAAVRIVREDESGGQKTTTIYASGYNTCIVGSTRRTERSLRVDY